MKDTKVNKRYIKKLLRRGEHITCRRCKQFKMAYRPYTLNNIEIRRYQCTGLRCDFEVIVPTGFKLPPTRDWQSEPKVFTLERYILADMLYAVDGVKYNPITHIIENGNSVRVATVDEHERYYKLIQESYANTC